MFSKSQNSAIFLISGDPAMGCPPVVGGCTHALPGAPTEQTGACHRGTRCQYRPALIRPRCANVGQPCGCAHQALMAELRTMSTALRSAWAMRVTQAVFPYESPGTM